MRIVKARTLMAAPVAAAVLLAACQGLDGAGDPAPVEVRASGLTVAERLAACDRDPRVVTGLVSRTICAGADIFFRETFGGNGRNCGTCHPAQNNTTIDPIFIQNLHSTNPRDPLFVFETNPALANLENGDNLKQNATVLENV